MQSTRIRTPESPVSSAEASTVPAFQYELMVYESIMDANRIAGGRIIREFFIPSAKVCFNEELAFKCSKPRNISTHFLSGQKLDSPLTHVQLSRELVDQVIRVAELNAQLKHEQDKFKLSQDFTALFSQAPRSNEESIIPGR